MQLTKLATSIEVRIRDGVCIIEPRFLITTSYYSNIIHGSSIATLIEN